MAAMRFRGKSKFLNIPSKIICNMSISEEHVYKINFKFWLIIRVKIQDDGHWHT